MASHTAIPHENGAFRPIFENRFGPIWPKRHLWELPRFIVHFGHWTGKAVNFDRKTMHFAYI